MKKATQVTYKAGIAKILFPFLPLDQFEILGSGSIPD